MRESGRQKAVGRRQKAVGTRREIALSPASTVFSAIFTLDEIPTQEAVTE
jgi:hypothetical protein